MIEPTPIDGANYGPRELHVMRAAFDDAWDMIVSHYGDSPVLIEAALRQLADAVILAASHGISDVAGLKAAALDEMALRYQRVEPEEPEVYQPKAFPWIIPFIRPTLDRMINREAVLTTIRLLLLVVTAILGAAYPDLAAAKSGWVSYAVTAATVMHAGEPAYESKEPNRRGVVFPRSREGDGSGP